MNVAAYQKKDKNEETKTGKRKAKGRRQATSFKEAAHCPSAVVQGAARRKNDLCEGSARGNWDPGEGQQPFRPDPNGVGDRTITLRRLLIGADSMTLVYINVITEVRRFYLSYCSKSVLDISEDDFFSFPYLRRRIIFILIRHLFIKDMMRLARFIGGLRGNKFSFLPTVYICFSLDLCPAVFTCHQAVQNVPFEFPEGSLT